MSTSNILSVEPIMAGLIPVAVRVVFKVHGAEGQRAYIYSSIEAVRGILSGDDPASWAGVRDDGGSGGSVETSSRIGMAIAEIGEIAEF